MGFFDKKFCDICGEKIGLLGNRKLEDGNLCKDCAKKLSPWFDERRHSTVEQIKKQLAYREANKDKAVAFHATRSFGDASSKLLIDENKRQFTVADANGVVEKNADILEFSQCAGCMLNIKENRTEEKKTVDGRSVSYNPPRYKYSYNFYVTIRVNNPYFDEMKFTLNSGSVNTGGRSMTGGSTGSWNISSDGFGYSERRGVEDYQRYVEMGNQLKDMLDSWQGSTYGNGMNAGFGAGMGMSGQNAYGQAGQMNQMNQMNPNAYGQAGQMMQMNQNAYGQAGQMNQMNPNAYGQAGQMNQMNQMGQNAYGQAGQMNQMNPMGQNAYGQAGQMNQMNPMGQNAYGQAGQMNQMNQMNPMGQNAYGQAGQMNPMGQNAYGQADQNAYGQQPAGDSSDTGAAQSDTWFCGNCGAKNSGKFCTSCGTKRM